MSHSTIAFTHFNDSYEAGTFLGSRLRSGLGGREPDAVILFASSRYDHTKLLAALNAACRPKLLVGCTSGGEFVSGINAEGGAVAIGLNSSTFRFSLGVGRGVRSSVERAARDIVSGFTLSPSEEYPYRSALILTDALAGQADQLIEQITIWSAGEHQLFGGAAGDDARYEKTQVFCGTEALTDAAVGLEILSKHPIGIGVQHAWVPVSDPMRVTSAENTRVHSFNSEPIYDVLNEFARKTGQTLDWSNPTPFFLQNIVGIETDAGYKLRVPIMLMPDRSVAFAAEVPEGSIVRIMGTHPDSGQQAASVAIESALRKLGPHKPGIALLFDCVATRMHHGPRYEGELEAIRKILGNIPYAGLNTYGQIARVEGQFSGFHNLALLVCILPE